VEVSAKAQADQVKTLTDLVVGVTSLAVEVRDLAVEVRDNGLELRALVTRVRELTPIQGAPVPIDDDRHDGETPVEAAKQTRIAAATPAARPRRKGHMIDHYAPLPLIPAGTVIDRLLAQRHAGYYYLSGGAHFTAPTAISPEGNLKPGTVDCSRLIAYAYMYAGGPWNCNAILADALGAQKRWLVVHHGERVRPGDAVVHAGPDLNHDGRPDAGGHGHIGGIVGVDAAFESLARDPELLEVVHSSGALQLHIDPSDPLHRPYGTVRKTGAQLWALAGYIVRARHVVYP
jgi:hypothetical protein